MWVEALEVKWNWLAANMHWLLHCVQNVRWLRGNGETGKRRNEQSFAWFDEGKQIECKNWKQRAICHHPSSRAVICARWSHLDSCREPPPSPTPAARKIFVKRKNWIIKKNLLFTIFSLPLRSLASFLPPFSLVSCFFALLFFLSPYKIYSDGFLFV